MIKSLGTALALLTALAGLPQTAQAANIHTIGLARRSRLTSTVIAAVSPTFRLIPLPSRRAARMNGSMAPHPSWAAGTKFLAST